MVMGSFWHQNFAILTSKITSQTARVATLATCGGQWCSLECNVSMHFLHIGGHWPVCCLVCDQIRATCIPFRSVVIVGDAFERIFHEIHKAIVIPTPLLTLCYGWRVGFVQANDNM